MPNAVPNTPNGSCSPTGAPALTAANAFRVGVDGNTAPLATIGATLPQPDYPGINAAAAGAGEALDPHFRPNVVDSVDFTIQRQLTNRVTLEAGYIGRYIKHEYLSLNVNAVPTMMTLGGQSFAQAYAAVETAMGCTVSAAACGANGAPTVATQPFFEAALSGTNYCNGFSSCTAAVVSKQFNNFASQAVWDLWSALDNGGTKPGFNFAKTMLNTVGQLSSGVGVNASVGYSNYNAGFATVRMSDWHGVTMQQNFTFSKALGTAALVQATSAFTADDPYNLSEAYGLQTFDRKFVYNLFMVYQPPFYKSQSGLVGHVLGGWSFAPVFSAGSGAPLQCFDNTGQSQAFGAADGVGFGTSEQCIPNNYAGTSASVHGNVPGGTDSFGNGVGTSTAGSTPGTELNMFSNPVAVWNNYRPPILGIDKRDGGFGAIRGLGYWNLDMSVKKQVKLTERFNSEFQIVFTNLLNHTVFFDPTLDITSPGSWGVLNSQGNFPRQMEFGLRVSF